jgi:peptidoglycan hydrolase CwlO-like protein
MEIEECESLGMSSNVMAMKKKLSEMQQNIVDDDNVIKAFQKEAEEMKSKLSEALKEYKSSGANGAETYGPLLKDVQFTIDAIL